MSAGRFLSAEEVAVAHEVGPIELRGFSKPVVAYEIVGLSDEVRP